MATAANTLSKGSANCARELQEGLAKLEGVTTVSVNFMTQKLTLEAADENFDAVLKVHLYGGYNVLRAAWPHFREQGFGRVVVATSTSGLFGNFGQANYGAAKLGLVGMINTLALEGAKYNIKANAIAPLALTRMTENIMGALGDKLDPGLISPLVAFLAHDDCPVSGQVFSVGGGRVASHEIMVATPAIRNLIREDKVAQMYSSIQTGQQFGMQTLDQNLQDLVKRSLVTRQQAREYAKDKRLFE